jgi:hypothetical protein
MCAYNQRMDVVFMRSCQRAEVMALCKSYNFDVSRKKVDLDACGYEDGPDLEVLRILVFGKSS